MTASVADLGCGQFDEVYLSDQVWVYGQGHCRMTARRLDWHERGFGESGFFNLMLQRFAVDLGEVRGQTGQGDSHSRVGFSHVENNLVVHGLRLSRF